VRVHQPRIILLVETGYIVVGKVHVENVDFILSTESDEAFIIVHILV